MSTNLSHDELRGLMLRQLEGEASVDEARQLSAELRASVEARREYVALARQHALLFELAEERKVVVLDKPRFETKAKAKSVFGWRRLAWAAGLLFFAGLAAVWIGNRSRTGEPPLLASAQGDVRFVGPAGERVLTSGEPWRRNEKLKTVGRNSAARVRFHDGSQLGFGSDTVVVNESGHEGHRVRLERGVLEADLRKQPAGRPFVCATPQAEAIVLGTRLRLMVEGHSTRLEVTDGTVRFQRRDDGAEVIVSTGQYAAVAPELPFAARPLPAGLQHNR